MRTSKCNETGQDETDVCSGTRWEIPKDSFDEVGRDVTDNMLWQDREIAPMGFLFEVFLKSITRSGKCQVSFKP